LQMQQIRSHPAVRKQTQGVRDRAKRNFKEKGADRKKSRESRGKGEASKEKGPGRMMNASIDQALLLLKRIQLWPFFIYYLLSIYRNK